MRYNPFRITPYLLKVQGRGSSGDEEEPCCLALAERIISGYEGTIISTTQTASPNEYQLKHNFCSFLMSQLFTTDHITHNLCLPMLLSHQQALMLKRVRMSL